MMVAHSYEYTKNYRVVYFKRVNFMIYEFYLNKRNPQRLILGLEVRFKFVAFLSPIFWQHA